MVKIRLKRMGRRNRPFYRLCAMDSREERDGMALEELGHYDPYGKKEEEKFVVKRERVEYWLSVGAQVTPKVKVLLRKAGVALKK
jgi:small subunit ribosomal protein S16